METHATGATRSTLYPKGQRFPIRLDLLLLNGAGLRRLAEAFGEGFLKYGRDNWKKGFPESVLLGHAVDHLLNYAEGDTSEDHLAHALWNLLTLCYVQEKLPELLDVTGAAPDAAAPAPSEEASAPEFRDLSELQKEQWRWARETFPDEQAPEILEHIKEELSELEGEPSNPLEMADVLLLLLCYASHFGVDLMKAASDKFEVCRQRSWWRTERGWRRKE